MIEVSPLLSKHDDIIVVATMLFHVHFTLAFAVLSHIRTPRFFYLCNHNPLSPFPHTHLHSITTFSNPNTSTKQSWHPGTLPKTALSSSLSSQSLRSTPTGRTSLLSSARPRRLFGMLTLTITASLQLTHSLVSASPSSRRRPAIHLPLPSLPTLAPPLLPLLPPLPLASASLRLRRLLLTTKTRTRVLPLPRSPSSPRKSSRTRTRMRMRLDSECSTA
jgi:hypothetical protein